VRDKGIAKQFQRTKNVAEKKRTKGASPTAIFRSPSRESGEAHTDLLRLQKKYFLQKNTIDFTRKSLKTL